MTTFNTALIGIGGYGRTHVDQMLKLSAEGILRCVAFADPKVEENRTNYDKLTGIGAKPYTDYIEMLDSHAEIDFVVLATPIPLHKTMSVTVMKKGFHVLTEKPPAVTIQDLDEMAAVSGQTGKRCGVSFQQTSQKSFRAMLDMLRNGELGELHSVTGIGMWMRTDDYYARTPWAGRLKHQGAYVLDGTLNNPFSHLFNNCLFAAGAGDPNQAKPLTVQAELYHGHDIEGEDTSCVRMVTRNGVNIHFYATLCHDKSETPFIRIKGALGEYIWHYDNKLTIKYRHGEERQLSYTDDNLTRNMYVNFMEGLSSDDVNIYCSVDACRSFMLGSNGAFESSRQIYPLPKDRWSELPSLITEAAAEGKLFSEAGADWAVGTKAVDVSDYSKFSLYD